MHITSAAALALTLSAAMHWAPNAVGEQESAPARSTDLHGVTIDGLSDEAPFTMTATLDRARLIVDLVLEDDWHAYSRDVGGGAPVQISMADHEHPSVLGALHVPQPEDGELSGRVRLEQWLELDEGQTDVDVFLSLTVCDALQCLPPFRIRLQGEVSPVRVLLVADQRDERADRVTTFLEERGFSVRVTTYGAVSREDCDAHDVVLADSKGFEQIRDLRAVARSFPKSETPLVAVGILGTELVEAHGLAMTSGYI
ncbi:MAG: hypothetical protein AAGB93_06530 [Planctomycetota bacterium]